MFSLFEAIQREWKELIATLPRISESELRKREAFSKIMQQQSSEPEWMTRLFKRMK